MSAGAILRNVASCFLDCVWLDTALHEGARIDSKRCQATRSPKSRLTEHDSTLANVVRVTGSRGCEWPKFDLLLARHPGLSTASLLERMLRVDLQVGELLKGALLARPTHRHSIDLGRL